VKFLVDESTGLAVSRKLKQMNFDAVSVIQSMKGADDEEIIRRAIDENRVIITNARASGQPESVNVGSYKTVPISAIAEKIVRTSHKAIKIKNDPSGSFGPINRTANISKASALLGWQPRTSLDEGLKHTYAWAEKRLAHVLSTGLYGNADKLLQAKTEADL
jgi:nucleoside-diphosphate-sugar epimerase